MTNPVTAMVSLANQLFDIQGKLNSYVDSLDPNIENEAGLAFVAEFCFTNTRFV